MEIELFDAGHGDTGHFVRGHVDRSEFVAAVASDPLVPAEICEDDVSHEYWRDDPDGAREEGLEPEAGEMLWQIAEADEPGAFSVTVARP